MKSQYITLNDLNTNYFINYSFNCNFTVVSFNMQSASSIIKFNEFKNMLYLFPTLPDVIVIQETWFSQSILNLYDINGYEAVHSCRPDNHGCLSIYVNHRLSFTLELSIFEHNMHFQAVKLRSSDLKNPLIVVGYYRPPSCPPSIFISQMESLMWNLNNSRVLFCGDSNIDLLRQSTISCNFTDVLSSFNYENIQKLISRPQTSSCIDHVICNFHYNVGMIHSIESNLSDHNVIVMCFNEDKVIRRSRSRVTVKLNYQQIRRELDTILVDQARYLQNNCNELYNEIEHDVKKVVQKNSVHTVTDLDVSASP